MQYEEQHVQRPCGRRIRKVETKGRSRVWMKRSHKPGKQGQGSMLGEEMGSGLQRHRECVLEPEED